VGKIPSPSSGELYGGVALSFGERRAFLPPLLESGRSLLEASFPLIELGDFPPLSGWLDRGEEREKKSIINI
jgi:hypothetical protein